ncbi:protein strawberry notch homolog 1-like [Antedon mediterranea]|uniref:protein strawberry notch homolog 1-like n=1 Tax=Antedon mediterranea TaxID=105859 RepID=UPI003AF626B0
MSEQPGFDLLSAAMNESGLSLDINDILNPPDDDTNNQQNIDTGGLISQALAQSGVSTTETDPLIEALQSTHQVQQRRPSIVIHPQTSRQTIVIPKSLGQTPTTMIKSATGLSNLQNNQILKTYKLVSKGPGQVAIEQLNIEPPKSVISNGKSDTKTLKIATSLKSQPKKSEPTIILTTRPSTSVVSKHSLLTGVASKALTSLAQGSTQAQAVKKDFKTINTTIKSWPNENAKNSIYLPAVVNALKAPKEEEPDEDEDEDGLSYADTYSDYMPSKLKLGIKHPDPVVETSSLASVQPPDVWYRLAIPESTIDYGHLSALQLEAVTYACQQHESFLASGERAGFLIGDGAGVGKGRCVAGIIFENYLLGRKRALWLSVSNDLKYDAQRDLKDIGANISVHSLNKFKYAKINSHTNNSVKKGVIFATYSSLIGESQAGGKYRTRLKQLVHWCGKDFDGPIILDECHKAKNLIPVGSSRPTKTGLTVLDLQQQLPKARIVYCSATGASEPKNMAYMTRLGLWGKDTPFPEFPSFIQAVERRGVGAMEIVAMDMKLRGMYIARQLSFHGVSFSIQEVSLAKRFIEIYNKSAHLWMKSRAYFQKAADLIGAEHRMRKSMWGQFWSAHQRFFKYMCIASKVPYAVKVARESVKNGKCVVIGLQSTGEARTLDALEEAGGELNDFVSTAKGVFSTLVEKHFPAPNRRKTLGGLFGWDFDDSRSNTPDSYMKEKTSRKRKRVSDQKSNNKRGKTFFDDDSDIDSNFDVSDNEKMKRLSDEESDTGNSELSSNDEDDFNPFQSDSFGDADPWLHRKERKKKNKKPKKNGEEVNNVLLAAGLIQKTNTTVNSKMTSQPSTKSTSIAPLLSTSSSSPFLPGMDAIEKAQLMKQELLDELEEMSTELPPNTLDELIDSLGGPENVAEMTGRKGRVVSKEDGNVQYEARSESDIPLEILNLTEKKRFMDAKKFVAVISEAASSGISLQADRRVKNQRRRVHITLELPWSADRAVQQFGRTHRSNQVTAPEYLFLISELAGEHRFASIVAKRLESLGALTHGDRRAVETRDLSRFNIDNKYGRTALETTMKSIVGLDRPLVIPPGGANSSFFKDIQQALIGVGMLIKDEQLENASLDKDYTSISKFLNRILGIQVDLQNKLFQYFMDTLNHIINNAKKDGVWDMGILDLGSEGENVKKLEARTFIGSFSTGTATTELNKVSSERGLPFETVSTMWQELRTVEEGFFLSNQMRNGKRMAIFVKAAKGVKKNLYQIFRPNTGLQGKLESMQEIKKKYQKVLPKAAEKDWKLQYNSSASQCSHAYWRGNCKRYMVYQSCEVGLRRRTYYILSGSVLSVWSKVEDILATATGPHSKMQILRLKTDDGAKLVGCLIPKNCVPALIAKLSVGATTYSKQFNSADSAVL